LGQPIAHLRSLRFRRGHVKASLSN
jgi:hypothetical protein